MMHGIKPKPSELASRYLLKEWKRRVNKYSTPPPELHEAAMYITLSLGYKKEAIDNMITAWIAKEHKEAIRANAEN